MECPLRNIRDVWNKRAKKIAERREDTSGDVEGAEDDDKDEDAHYDFEGVKGPGPDDSSSGQRYRPAANDLNASGLSTQKRGKEDTSNISESSDSDYSSRKLDYQHQPDDPVARARYAVEHINHTFAGADSVAVPLSPIQYFKNMPTMTAQRTAEPSIAPVRVAKITSPEPIYSAHQTKDGPTKARTARPRGGVRIVVSSISCEAN